MTQPLPSATQLTSEFSKQLAAKLTDTGSLQDLLSSHLEKNISAFAAIPLDRRIITLVVQCLATDFAIEVASNFPTRLAKELDTAARDAGAKSPQFAAGSGSANPISSPGAPNARSSTPSHSSSTTRRT